MQSAVHGDSDGLSVAPNPCELIPEGLERIADDDRLASLLSGCLVVEQSLMLQYLYMLCTMPQICEAGDFTQEVAIRETTRDLHHLALQEMGHLATACNLCIIFGGQPTLGQDLFARLRGSARPLAPLAFSLEPLGAKAIDRLIEYETRDPDMRVPVEMSSVAMLDVASDEVPTEKLGSRYRRVYYEVCMRKTVDQREFQTPPDTGWAPFHGPSALSGKTDGYSILPFAPNEPPRFRNVSLLDAMRSILIEGEGGAPDDERPELSHVCTLHGIRSRLDVLGRISRRVVESNPMIDSADLDGYAKHLAVAVSRAYEVVLSSLYVLWLNDLRHVSRQEFFVPLSGFMSSVLFRLGSLLATTPIRDDSDRFIGPPFACIDPVKPPTSLADAVAQIRDRMSQMLQALTTVKDLAPPRGTLEANERETYVANALQCAARFGERADALLESPVP